MSIKLNLASGTDLREGWINLDIVEKWPTAARGCDIIWDARKDKIPFTDGSVSEIYAGYLFLHLAPDHHLPVLKEIHRALSTNGTLMVGEVDMAIVMKRFLEDPTDKRIHELIWGEQGNFHGEELSQFDKHCHGFTQETLAKLLLDNGFENCRRGQIHTDEVFYELTIVCSKSTQQ